MVSGFDTSEITAFAAELAAAPTRARAEVRKAVKKGGLNIKTEAQALIRSQIRPRHMPHYAKDITFEVIGQGMTVEVGPENLRGPGHQGASGRGVEFGSVNHGPLPHLFPAFEREEPGYLRALGDAIFGPLE